MINIKTNEIFNSIQGEGPATGQPATFVRFSGCNLKCNGCDTDHSSSIDFSPREIVEQCSKDLIVITGGEPTLQDDLGTLVTLLYHSGYVIDIETNGTHSMPSQASSMIRNLVVSPKRSTKVILESKYGNVWYKFVIGDAPWTWTFPEVESFLRKSHVDRHRTYLMPYGTDLQYAQTVWDYCANHDLLYSDRLQWRVNRK